MRPGATSLTGLATLTAAVMLAAACGSSGSSGTTGDSTFANCDAKPNTCNSGTAQKGGTLIAASEKDVFGWNINDANANTFDIIQMLMGVLVAGPFIIRPDFSVTLNDDLMVSADRTNPLTVVYKIRPEAVWSDGTPISADDFIWRWRTNNGKECAPKACAPASRAGYDQISSVVGSDGGKTVTVTFSKPFADWRQLFIRMYPAHIAQQHGDLAAAWKWFNDTVPNYSGGPYQITNYTKGDSLTLVPNPKWYGKVKPALNKLVYKIITKQTEEVPALQNGEVNEIYPQPNQDIVSQVKGLANVKYRLGKGLTWEHVDLNLKSPALGDNALRQAIFTVIDRKSVIAKTVGQFASGIEPLGNHNLVPGQQGYTDLVTPTGQGSGDLEKAKQLLTSAGYTGVGSKLANKSGTAVPALRMRYTVGNTVRQQTCELVQAALKKLGIDVTIQTTDDLGGTLTKGDYDLIDFAWVTAPFVSQGASQLWLSTSSSNYNHFTNEQSDSLINQAIQSTGPQEEVDLVNQADKLMVDEAVVLPLYQKSTLLAVASNLVNIRDNATNQGPTYNLQEWGIKSAQ
jgi:peptide/nickel transport system substrate-binding protein